MRPLQHLSTVVLAVLVLAGCGAGERSTDATGEAALSAPLFETSTASAEARQHYVEGIRLWDEGKGLEAREHFELALAADPEWGLLHMLTAQAGGGIAGGAVPQVEYRAALQRAVDRKASATEAERLLIEISEKLTFDADPEAAFAAAQRLTEIAPQNARAWQQLAFRHAQMDRIAEARATMEKALEVNPAYAPALAWLAGSYTQASPELQDAAKAEEHARKMVELEPENPRSYDFLGDAFRTQGKLQEAADAYSRMIELDPENALGRLQRAHAHLFLGNPDAARADYDESVALGNAQQKVGFMYYRPLVHLDAGDPQAAIAEWEEQLQAVDGMGVPDPDAAKRGILAVISSVALHHGLLEVAESALQRWTALEQARVEELNDPDISRRSQALQAEVQGWTAAFGGDVALARQKANEAMELREPDRGPRRFEFAHHVLGLAALKEQKFTEALAHFDQGDANDVYAQYLRAKALEGAGRQDEAMEIYRGLAGFYFADPSFMLVRKEILAKAGGA